MAQDTGAATIEGARQHIKHVIIIMQENRSFDSYFGTFPGADGLPKDAQGKFTICVPLDTKHPGKGCVKPFHDTSLVQSGGPHLNADFLRDHDHGKMNGFVQNQTISRRFCQDIQNIDNPLCIGLRRHDVMGYHTDHEIPNYWKYAEIYMLQDHLYEPIASYSLGSHLMMVSEWDASCKSVDPMSCTTTVNNNPVWPAKSTPFSWTALTWLLDLYKVTWAYYLSEGKAPDCDGQDTTDTCDPEIQTSNVYNIWNPLPGFVTFSHKVKAHPNYASHVATVNAFYRAVATRTLPAVSWIIPNSNVSEHPPANVVDGMDYVTGLINTIMQSPYYPDTVILVAWDDWGGFYDHKDPPVLTRTPGGGIFGYGFRVPGLVISPYVARHIDHQTLSFDAYNRFIEDVFLHSNRLDPRTDGRPDSRPAVYEALTIGFERGGKTVRIGDLLNDFDFAREPIPPMILSNQISNH
jgi:phospholipase C